jgi:hypothetical protein
MLTIGHGRDDLVKLERSEITILAFMSVTICTPGDQSRSGSNLGHR